MSFPAYGDTVIIEGKVFLYMGGRPLSALRSTHRASRDKFAQALVRYKDSLGEEAWGEAAYHFQKSGEIIEKIVDGFLEDVSGHSFRHTEKYIPLFRALRKHEDDAFRRILNTQN